MVAHEDDHFQVLERWEAVSEVDVHTPLEVYRCKARGYVCVHAIRKYVPKYARVGMCRFEQRLGSIAAHAAVWSLCVPLIDVYSLH